MKIQQGTEQGPRLRFPLTSEYPGVIEFRRVKVIPPELAWETVVDVASTIATTVADEDDNSQTIDGESYTVSQKKTGYFYNPSANVRLYLPQALQLADNIGYDNTVELGIVGGMANRVLSETGNLSSTAKAIVTSAQQGLSSVTDLIGKISSPDAARVALARAPLPQPIGNAAINAARIALNPNRKTLFRDVRPREFSFQYKLIASSPAEARAISGIVNFFRTEMYPVPTQALENQPEQLKLAYDYPNMFDIRMSYNGKQVGYKMLPCYLVSFNATYNPSNMGYHVDGHPSEMDVTMTFFEERPIDRSDVERGY